MNAADYLDALWDSIDDGHGYPGFPRLTVRRLKSGALRLRCRRTRNVVELCGDFAQDRTRLLYWYFQPDGAPGADCGHELDLTH